MTWQSHRISVPLGEKPALLWATVGIHGPDDTRRYCFDHVWIVHLYRYTGSVEINGATYPIRPGFASIMPPGATSVTRFPFLSRHLFAHFVLPQTTETQVSIPTMQDLADKFAVIHDAFEEMLGYSATYPLRAEVRLWDILWRLAEQNADPANQPLAHPAVQRVKQIVEMRLTERLRVADLAREIEISQNHLNRLFRAATGTTISAYINTLRMQRAHYLLTHSSLSIRAIAEEVGITDLHYFNKTIRRNLGDAPRRVRARRPAI